MAKLTQIFNKELTPTDVERVNPWKLDRITIQISHDMARLSRSVAEFEELQRPKTIQEILKEEEQERRFVIMLFLIFSFVLMVLFSDPNDGPPD